jgi:hypothetical protein
MHSLAKRELLPETLDGITGTIARTSPESIPRSGDLSTVRLRAS